MSLEVLQLRVDYVEEKDGLLAKEIMTKDVFTVMEDDSLLVLQEVMKWRAIRHVPVVDQQERIIGLLSHRDLLKLTVSALAEIDLKEEEALLKRIPIAEVMGRKVWVVGPEIPIKYIAQEMVRQKIGCLPVVDEDQKILGIITEADFVKLFASY